MKSLCGVDCTNCQWNAGCKGCSDEKCFIARYIKLDGKEKYEEFKQTLIDEFNGLAIPGMSEITGLYPLVGNYVNLEYALPNGQKVKFLDNNSMYLGNQVECEIGEGRCFGLIAGMDFLLVAEYGENCSDVELIMYKRR
ncbi:MAG: DUF3795 domain-containing protein [Oscillospiraceae bacterium]|nr:DUF3795 domain-containing protein [Oscillospiraceae bacterium]